MAELPAWACPEKYEYDLGMATECEGCGADLKEGSVVYRDTDPGSYYHDTLEETVKSRPSYYCSVECVRAAEGSAL